MTRRHWHDCPTHWDVVEYLAVNPRATMAQMRDALGGCGSLIYGRLMDAVDEGLVQAVPDLVHPCRNVAYEITRKGAREMLWRAI